MKKNKTQIINTDVTESTENSESTATTEQATTTTSTTYSIDDLTKVVDINNPTWDLFLIGFFVIGAGLYGLSLGKDRVIAIMVSIYMALAVVAALPAFVLNIKINENYTVQITAFLAVFVILFFILSRQAVLTAMAPNSHGKWWQVIVFSFLHVGLLVSVTMSFLPPQLLSKFSPIMQFIFTSEWTKFGWIITPILAMILVGRDHD